MNETDFVRGCFWRVHCTAVIFVGIALARDGGSSGTPRQFYLFTHGYGDGWRRSFDGIIDS